MFEDVPHQETNKDSLIHPRMARALSAQSRSDVMRTTEKLCNRHTSIHATMTPFVLERQLLRSIFQAYRQCVDMTTRCLVSRRRTRVARPFNIVHRSIPHRPSARKYQPSACEH